MRGLLLLGLAGAGAYYAVKQGYLPQAAPLLEEIERRAATFLPQSQWEDQYIQSEAEAAAIYEASGGKVVPILGPDEVITTNVYEAMLRSNMANVSGWAKRNIGWAAAICRVENAQRNPAISGDNGTSHGVLQVKVATAETCARAGYTKYAPTKANLLTYEGGIYFGTAEMERLAAINPDRDWIIQAYNGGAGFKEMPAKYIADRGKYLVKVKKAFADLYGKGMA